MNLPMKRVDLYLNVSRPFVTITEFKYIWETLQNVSLTLKYILPTGTGKKDMGPVLTTSSQHPCNSKGPLVSPLLGHSRGHSRVAWWVFYLDHDGCLFPRMQRSPRMERCGLSRRSHPLMIVFFQRLFPLFPGVFLPLHLPSSPPIPISHTLYLFIILMCLLSDSPTGTSASWVQGQGLWGAGVSVLFTDCMLSTKNSAWPIVGSQ